MKTSTTCAVALACCLSLGGLSVACASEQADPAPAAQSTSDTAQDQDAELAIPEHYFTAGDGKIVDVFGNVIDAPINEESTGFKEDGGRDEVRYWGALAQDRVLKVHTTSSYDAEWRTEYDLTTHVELVDSQGATVADLDPVLSAYGASYSIMATSDHFADDRFAINAVYELDDGSTSYVTVVVDREGTEIYSMGDNPLCTYAAFAYGCAPTYAYGLALTNDLDDYLSERKFNLSVFLDVNGAVVSVCEHVVQGALGPNYCFYDSHGRGSSVNDQFVWNLNGEQFRAETLSTDTIRFEGGDQAFEDALGSNILVIEGSESNPYGGTSRTVLGLYNVATGTWIVPAFCGRMNYTGSVDGRIYVSAYCKELLLGQPVADEAATYDFPRYSCIMDENGTIVFDLAMSGIELTAEDGAYFEAEPVVDGYWLITCGAARDRSYLIYFDEDGVYTGAVPTTLHPSSAYLYQM